MLAIFWLASKHTSNVCTTNQPTCPRPATLSQEKAKENKRILKWNYCFRTHTHMQLAQWPHPQPLGNTQGRSRSRRPVKPEEEVENIKNTLSCYAHKTHPAKWQISMATRSGQLMSFCRQMSSKKNFPNSLVIITKYPAMLPGFRSVRSVSVNGRDDGAHVPRRPKQ